MNKWIKSYGFELNTIIYIVKSFKTKKRRLDINTLDEALTKYFEMRLTSIPEIENYENEKENLFNLAIAINRELGIYYEDVTKEIDSYIVNWQNMGFDQQTLITIADNCFKSSIRTLEGFNNILLKLFRLGIVNLASYNQYINDNLAMDSKIKEVLTHLKLARNVNNGDRSFYAVWTGDWGFAHDVVLYASDLSAGKTNALQYLNKILSNWNTAGTKTLEQAKQTKVEDTEKSDFIHNNYTKEQIASFITNLDEVEV